jgi:hypothetical protein
MGIGAIIALVYAWQMAGTDVFWTLVFPTTLGFGSGSVLLGRLMILIAGRRSARWRLWAQVLLHLGGVLSFSLPLFVYGLLYFANQVAELNGVPPPVAIGPIHSWRLSVTVLVSGAPFLIGLGLLFPALIWGRFKPGQDVPAVFS